MNLPKIQDADVENKTVLLRVDVDVPLEYQKSNIKNQIFEIGDDARLRAWFPTLQLLLEKGAKVIACGHLGRPEATIQNSEFSLLPVARWLCQKLNSKNEISKITVSNFEGWKISDSITLLENLRFYKGEKDNYLEFAQKLASLAQIYVNDSFAVCHRKDASIVGVAKLLPHFAGLHLQKEIEALSKVSENPQRPLVVIIGGAKIETKLPLVEKMHSLADYVLVGGKIAEEIKTLLKVQHEKIRDGKSILLVADHNQDGTDITPNSVENFLQIIQLAKTVVWNGPVGKTANGVSQIANSSKDSEKGTRELANGIIKTNAYTIVGGGDTLGFLKKENLLDKFSFYSTGGGAMLSFLSGEKLPGLSALG